MKWLTLALQFLPTVLNTVVAIEGVAINVPGVNKKQMVLNIITAGAKGAESAPNATVQGIGQLIDAVVGELNSSGVFNKGVKS